MRAAEESVLVVARRGYLRELGLPTIFAAAVLFVSATLLLGVNISALRGNLVWVEHSQNMLRNINNLETALMGEELTVRGYALTGDKRFLTFQDSERGKAAQALRELDRLTQAEPQHARLLQAVRNDVERHLVIYGQLKGAGPAQADRVAHAIVDFHIRAITGRARANLGILRNQEQIDLTAHQREMTSQISRAFFLSIGIILAAVLLGGFGLLASQIPLSLRR